MRVIVSIWWSSTSLAGVSEAAAVIEVVEGEGRGWCRLPERAARRGR